MSASRSSLDSLARAAALDLDANWQRVGRPAGRIDVIDMFSGCGGMSAGFVSVNSIRSAYHLVGAIDIDPVANETYELNLGVVPRPVSVADLARRPALLRDTIAPVRVGNRRRPLVLIGCAPCQGFSSHRNRRGERDRRNSLFVDFVKVALQISPDAVVIENVPEILSDRYWPLVARARGLLEKAGYFVNLSVHNMAEFGIPQERFRALILAMRKPFRPVRGFLGRERFRTVREAIGWLPDIAAGERHSEDPMHYTAGHRESTLATIRAVPKDGGSRPEHVGPDCLRRAKEKNGRAAYEDVYGRLWWDRPAITVTAYARNPASGRYVHPEQDRGLSVREAALLQSFPRNYEFAGTLDERFRQIGNAVPPAFAAYLAAHVVRELSAAASPKFDKGLVGAVGPSFSRLIPALKAGWRKAA